MILYSKLKAVVTLNVSDANEGNLYYIYKYDEAQVAAFENDLEGFDLEKCFSQWRYCKWRIRKVLTLASTTDKLFVVSVGTGDFVGNIIDVTGSEKLLAASSTVSKSGKVTRAAAPRTGKNLNCAIWWNTDGDGICDYLDDDMDNDGIPIMLKLTLDILLVFIIAMLPHLHFQTLYFKYSPQAVKSQQH